MADFRSLVEDLHHISVPQAELVVEDGKVLLDDLEDEVRAAVEVELRHLPQVIEEGVQRVEDALERLANSVSAKADELADEVAPDDNDDAEPDAPEVDN